MQIAEQSQEVSIDLYHPNIMANLIVHNREMMDVYTKCAILIPPVKLKRTDRFKIAVYSFWNREKVEELISELKERVDKAFRLFFVRALLIL